jgi:hypothetical protein
MAKEKKETWRITLSSLPLAAVLAKYPFLSIFSAISLRAVAQLGRALPWGGVQDFPLISTYLY